LRLSTAHAITLLVSGQVHECPLYRTLETGFILAFMSLRHVVSK